MFEKLKKYVFYPLVIAVVFTGVFVTPAAATDNVTTVQIINETQVPGWTVLLIAMSFGMMIVLFFRFNLLFVIAAITVDLAIINTPDMPLPVYYFMYLVMAGEAFATTIKIFFPKKKAKRYVG